MRIQWSSRNTVTGRELGLEFGEAYKVIGKINQRLAALESIVQSGASDTLGSLNIRRDSVAVAEGTNVITFSSPLQSSNYALSSLPVFVSSSETAQANLTGKSSTGFTCWSPSAGTLDYTAIEIA